MIYFLWHKNITSQFKTPVESISLLLFNTKIKRIMLILRSQNKGYFVEIYKTRISAVIEYFIKNSRKCQSLFSY